MQQQNNNSQQRHIQNALFYTLSISLVALLAFLSLQFRFEVDLTYSQRNTLSDATAQLLTKLDKPIEFVVFASESEELRKPIQTILARYQALKNDITITFIDPEREPQLVRENNIRDGETIVKYDGRQEKIGLHDELSYSNVLQRLARNDNRWIIFTKGHGEREPHRPANHDVSDWIKIATERGYKAQAHNLIALGTIPDNTSILVIASPQIDFLAGEVAVIEDYLNRGGNLLWLVDPGSLAQLDNIANQLRLEFDPGTIVDPTGKAISIQDPRFSVVTDYPSHPITRDFSVLTLFPTARAISLLKPETNTQTKEQWRSSPLLLSQPRSWSERGKLSGKIRFDADSDAQGPLVLGVALNREIATSLTPAKQANGAILNKLAQSDATSANPANPENPLNKKQRIVVIGDGDFLSNTYSGNGGNIELGLNILNWLSNDPQLLQIPVIAAPDKQLLLSTTTQAIIAIVFLFILPLGFASYATLIWYKRRKL